MRERLKLCANGAFLCLATMTLATLQASFWFQIFGYFPAPGLWITAIIFIGLYRSLVETTILVYIICFLLSPLTVLPLGHLMIPAISVALLAKFVKQRIYWEGTGYFMIVAGSGVLLFHLIQYFVSLVFEESAISSPEVLDWLIEALFTPLIAPLTFRFFIWIDDITGRQEALEASAEG